MNKLLFGMALHLLATVIYLTATVTASAQFGGCGPGFCRNKIVPSVSCTALLTGLIGNWDASVTASLLLSPTVPNQIEKIIDQSSAGSDLNTPFFTGVGPTYDPVGLAGLPTMVFISANTMNIANSGNFPMGSGNTLTFYWVGTRANAGFADSRAMAYAQPGA